MQRTRAIRSFLIIPFLLLAGCQEQPKPDVYELVCTQTAEEALAQLEKNYPDEQVNPINETDSLPSDFELDPNERAKLVAQFPKRNNITGIE